MAISLTRHITSMPATGRDDAASASRTIRGGKGRGDSAERGARGGAAPRGEGFGARGGAPRVRALELAAERLAATDRARLAAVKLAANAAARLVDAAIVPSVERAVLHLAAIARGTRRSASRR